MSRGKRYNGEQKLNLKKVFAVIITIIVIIMFFMGIKHILKKKIKMILIILQKFHISQHITMVNGV